MRTWRRESFQRCRRRLLVCLWRRDRRGGIWRCSVRAPAYPSKFPAQLAKRIAYSHVISTIPLPVVCTVNLTQAGLSIMQSNALRQLQYGPSIKIGIQFTEPWWTSGADEDGKPIGVVGGQSFTDPPFRTVVYPSYGLLWCQYSRLCALQRAHC